MRKLRVGIDGRAFASPAAGVRRYVANLVPALGALDEPLEIVALGGSPADAVSHGLEHVPAPSYPPTNLGWTLVGLPRAASRARVDLIHSPAYTGPFSAAVPFVLTIHDVSYERHPEWYPYRRDWLRRAFYRRSARAAAHILTVSEFSAGEIAAAYSIPRDRITIAPHGVAPVFAADGSGISDPGCNDEPADLSTPYLLHVGDLHERRDLTVVVDAMCAARRRVPHTLRLMLAGIDRGVTGRLRARAAASGAGDAIVSLGAVSDACLRLLYRHAAALVYPSVYEGFGLPVLEAMASGTPVIASREASIPEVLGDAGILLDPHDVPAWTGAIVTVVSDDRRRGLMQAAGRARAVHFTWDRTARATLAVYQRVAAR